MKVLVGIDGGEQQRDALALGAALAADGELTVVTVYPWSRWSVNEVTVREDAEAILARAREELPGRAVATRAVAGLSAPRTLHELAEDTHADVLVIGSCHRGPIGHALLGGTGERVVHGAPCPVAVAPRGYADGEQAMRRVAVAYLDMPEGDGALGWATTFAERTGATLTLLSVLEPVMAGVLPASPAYGYAELTKAVRDDLRAALDRAVGRTPESVRPEGRLLEGPAGRTLAEAGEDFDLVVIGSRGYGPVGRLLLGNVSGDLMRRAKRPVVVLPRSAVEAEAEADDRDAAPATA